MFDVPQILSFLQEGLGYVPSLESDAAAREWLAGLTSKGKLGHYINGSFETFEGESSIESLNPTNPADVLMTTPCGSSDAVNAAMTAAQAAFPSWSGLSGFERALYLYAIGRALKKHARIIAVLESLDNGKPIRESRDADGALMQRHFSYHAGLASIMANEFQGYRPGGVIGQIIPWNFPGLMWAWKIAPAIAAGNTVVIKPAETTPLVAAFIAHILIYEVKLPKGVVNIVFGDGTTGAAIAAHSTPWKIAFTGSTKIGRLLRTVTAGEKKLTLELGGKSANIVFADSDLDAAVEGIINSIFFNKGEVCCAGSRLLVEEGVADLLIQKLQRRMTSMRVGPALDKCTDIGPLNSKQQFDKVTSIIQAGKEAGGSCWQPECSLPEQGWFVPPTIFTGVAPADALAQEEIFGPVLVIMTFRTPAEAISLANNTRYGLAACVWTESIGKAHEVAAAVKAGTVWINCANTFDAASGFGGYRESGYGREGGSEGFYDVLVPDFPTPSAPLMTEEAAEAAADHEEVQEDAVIDRDEDPTAPALFDQGPQIDRTYRFLVGGKLCRPDGASSFRVTRRYNLLSVVGNANRKDVRNAVQAAEKAQPAWAARAGHNRAQILFFLAENLSARRNHFVSLLMQERECSRDEAEQEFGASLERLFLWAAYADKFGGSIPEVPGPYAVNAVNEAIGVMGIRAPDNFPLLGLVHTIGVLIARGNTVVLVAGNSPTTACELIQVIQNSDVPAGVVNILTAQDPDHIGQLLAYHMAVDGVWFFGGINGCTAVEKASAGNMKRTYTSHGDSVDLLGPQGTSSHWLHQASQVKNVWIPVGA